MSTSQKLTKKQKKGLAFRERKTGKRQQGKGRHRNELSGMEYNAIPSMEGEVLLGLEGDPAQDQGVPRKDDRKTCRHEEGDAVQRKKGKSGSKSKGDAEKEDVSVSVAVLKGKKRTREDDGVEAEGREDRVEVEGRSKTKRKKVAKEGKEEEEKEKQQKNQPKQKFILFIGNLKYTTTKEKIESHFALCDPLPSVRLLTPKVKAGQKSKSKGCAFLEFTHKNALQQALKLHQSNLEGRLINVELTAGGGGKSESRLAKVRERNKALLGQRVKRVEEHEENGPSLPQKPQRHSMTSGLEHTPETRKTWTVGDVDDKQSRRGHRKKSKSRVQLWTTGANAIPVD